MTKANVVFHHVWTSGLTGAGISITAYLAVGFQIHSVHDLTVLAVGLIGAAIAGFFGGVRAGIVYEAPQLAAIVTPVAVSSSTPTNTVV